NNEVTKYNYDAFGNLMENSVVGEQVAYQYTGQDCVRRTTEYAGPERSRRKDEINLHNFRARFYDSDIMRFYAVDPAEQTASPYLFCGNNPVMYVDPDGEWHLSITLGVFGFNVGDSGVEFDVGVLAASANIGVSASIDSKAGFSASASAGASASVLGWGVALGGSVSAMPTTDGWKTTLSGIGHGLADMLPYGIPIPATKKIVPMWGNDYKQRNYPLSYLPRAKSNPYNRNFWF
ncbi:MAG: RHS repeat-associated core domain-containing protein, partial [Candidatus Cloacimonetes bacterium]|nr:RHS repeat-associated core domain-containing protein [Candidatus Cloacimonadota bacterium]